MKTSELNSSIVLFHSISPRRVYSIHYWFDVRMFLCIQSVPLSNRCKALPTNWPLPSPALGEITTVLQTKINLSNHVFERHSAISFLPVIVLGRSNFLLKGS